MGRTSRIGAWWRSGVPLLAMGWAVLRRPQLWPESLRQARAVASRSYRSFRSVTAYGDPHRAPTARDVVAWLTWAKAFRRL